jgi:hypothetical protein
MTEDITSTELLYPEEVESLFFLLYHGGANFGRID